MMVMTNEEPKRRTVSVTDDGNLAIRLPDGEIATVELKKGELLTLGMEIERYFDRRAQI